MQPSAQRSELLGARETTYIVCTCIIPLTATCVAVAYSTIYMYHMLLGDSLQVQCVHT